MGLVAAVVPASSGASGTTITNQPPVVVVLCDFADYHGDPNDVQYYKNMFTDSGAGMLGLYNFWRDVSYGNLDLAGTKVVGWVTVKDADGNDMTRWQMTGLTTGHQVQRCVETAQDDPANADIDFSHPVMISVLASVSPSEQVQTTLAADISDSDTTITVTSAQGFPDPPFFVYIGGTTDSPYADELNVTAVDGTTWTVVRNYERPPAKAHQAGENVIALSEAAFQGLTNAWAALSANVDVTGAAHEMGHLFTMDHSRRLSTSFTDYDDCYDIMSDSCTGYSSSGFYAGAYAFTDPDFGDPNSPFGNGAGPGLNAVYLDRQGWMPAGRETTFDDGPCSQASFDMAALSRSDAPGWLEVRRPSSVTITNAVDDDGNATSTTMGDYYTIELRNNAQLPDRTNWDQGLPADAFVLHLHGQDELAYWVDVDPGGNVIGHSGGLYAGDEYFDTANDTYLAVNSIDHTAGTGVVSVGACKIQPQLSYNGGTHGKYGEAATLAAQLTVGGSAPVPGATVNLTLGSQSCSATTDPAGEASCQVTLADAPGSYTAGASYAGDPAYATGSDAASFTIEKEDTQILNRGALRQDFNDVAVFQADLTTPDLRPVAGKNVLFTLGSQSCMGTTDANGSAMCSITIAQHPGGYSLVISFAGDTFYEGSSDSESFTIDKEESQVAYTGVLTSDYHDAFTASAKLTDPDGGAPIAGKAISFTLGAGDSCSATTDGSGAAACSITPTQAAGTVSMTASFAGDIDYVPSSQSKPFVITREETTLTYTGPTVILQGASGVTLKARLLEDGTTPPVPSGQTITLSLGAQSCQGTTDATGAANCTLTFTGPLGPEPLGARFDGDPYYLPSADTSRTAIVFAFPSRGAFVLGNTTVAAAGPTTTVTWWADTWAGLNSLAAGAAPPSFKGFAASVATLPTASPANSCGSSFTTTPGNSPPPPATVPSYMGVLVAGSVSKSGSTITGTWGRIVVVATKPGYAPNPGSPGTGTIVATFCP